MSRSFGAALNVTLLIDDDNRVLEEVVFGPNAHTSHLISPSVIGMKSKEMPSTKL